MRNLLTIMRRELGAYVNSSIGALFLIVFTLISSVIFVTEFFLFPVAELRSFFTTLPFLLCVFVPAVTMRVWAEEWANNTVELLLTFPMHPLALVLGKFLASFCFLLVALASTLLLPVMLFALGTPDLGQIASSYLGAILLGTFFLSLGQLVSGFAKDQIVAFVLSLLACFALFLLGTPFIATALDGWITGLGSTLARLLGVTSHYAVFTRGIVELTDVLFFLGWSAVFLFLNGLYLEGRNRRSFGFLFSCATVLCMGLGLVCNALIKDMSLGRFDWTAGQIHTLSPASKRILAALKAPVQVTYYVTPEEDMPTEIKTLERDVLDRLEELQRASGGKFSFSRVHMRASNVLGTSLDQHKLTKNALEKRMLEKGVEPFSVSALRQTGSVSNLIYSSLGVAYLNKPEEILANIVPDSLRELEFAIMSTIFRLSLEKQPVVALVGGEKYTLVRQVLEQEKYQVRDVLAQEHTVLPVDADVLLILEPHQWSKRQAWELGEALARGQKTMLAIQAQHWEYDLRQGTVVVQRSDQDSGLDDVLAALGVGVEPKVLMDEQTIPVRVARSQVDQVFGGGINLNLPIHIVLTKNAMNPDEPITARLENLFYLWGSALTCNQDVLAQHGIEATVLMSSSNKSWLIDQPEALTQALLATPQQGLTARPVALCLRGQFPPNTEPIPDNAEHSELPEQSLERALHPGELVLIGGATMFGNDLLENNIDFLLNTVDYLAFGPDLLHIRGKKPVSRAIFDIGPQQAMLWKVLAYCLPTLCITAFAVLRAWTRIRRRHVFARTLEKIS